jgi:hypothetical protein
VIEARGRTGRKPTAAEKRGEAGQTSGARQKRLSRLDRPPTWRSAFLKALVAAVFLFVLALVLVHSAAAAFLYFVFGLLLYTPISYYTDLWMFRRRRRGQRRDTQGKTAAR